jgi:hypothetical protein
MVRIWKKSVRSVKKEKRAPKEFLISQKKLNSWMIFQKT